MKLRHDVMAAADLDEVVGETTLDDVVGDTTVLDDERLADERLADDLAGLVEFTSAFLAWAEGPLLRSDFARFSYGAYTLEELRADLGRLGAWIRTNA